MISLAFFALDMPYYSQCAVQLLSAGTWPAPDFTDTVVDRLSDVTDVVMLLPTIAVTVRRLHDIGKSGWWYVYGLVPLLGWFTMPVWLCRKGTGGGNRFGADPLRVGHFGNIA